jgi:cyclopropane fatty-acyl-phospholipid synthase-like methyltransferase
MIINSVPWNQTYGNDNRIWGDKPSELTLYAYNYLKQNPRFSALTDIFVLDLGCGYGRDAIFLAQNLPCHVLGLDNSETAIEMARESIPKEVEKKIELLCYDFSNVSDKYDVMLASGLYQFLNPGERANLRETVKRCLKSDGVFFLGTLSVRDPQHIGKGTPVEGEENSVMDGKYHHFCTRQELEKDFDFLKLYALFEREYTEWHSTSSHHHISWILMGMLK